MNIVLNKAVPQLMHSIVAAGATQEGSVTHVISGAARRTAFTRAVLAALQVIRFRATVCDRTVPKGGRKFVACHECASDEGVDSGRQLSEQTGHLSLCS